MRKAEIKAKQSNFNNLDTKHNDSIQSELEPKDGVKLSVWNAIIPIGTLIVTSLIFFYYSGYTSIVNGDNIELQNLMVKSPLSFLAIKEAFSSADASVALFQSSIISSIVAILMAVSKKIFKVSEAIEIWIDGMKSLLMTAVILILAWSLSSVIKDLGTAKFLVTLLSGSMPAFLLPSVIFILGSIISFSTGTAYGTMGILMPLAIPLAHSINPDISFIVISTSAVLTGAIFGDHCSPISDTTILSSMGAGCNHIDHVKTQMPYALFVASITVLFGYIPAGLGISIYIVIPISIIAIFIGVQLFGKKADEYEVCEVKETLI